MLNNSVVDSNINPVNEKSLESADEDENGEEMEFEIPDEEISQANENEIEAIEVRTECKTENEDGTADGTKVEKQNTTEDVNFQKVVKMRGAEDYLGKNDLTKYENRKDSVTRLDNKIGKSSDQSESSDQKDLKQDSKNIQIDEIEKKGNLKTEYLQASGKKWRKKQHSPASLQNLRKATT